MNISIITGLQRKCCRKAGISKSLFGYQLGLVIGLLAAMFVLRILRRIQSPHHRLRMLSKIVIFACTISRLSPLANGKMSVLRALARWPEQTVVGCHQIVLFRWHSKRAFLRPLTLLIIKKRL